MLGIFGVFWLFGTVSGSDILAAAILQGRTGHRLPRPASRYDEPALFCCSSARWANRPSFGLHTWLPDAMEGPTPVSALIHAATMVTAGVSSMVCLSPLFETSQFALNVVTIVGATTALFAATVGLVQTDDKRVIAYSTCRELGYMFFAA